MNVLIINTNRNALPVPVMPIGACMVAEAAERAGHEVRLLDLMFEKDPLSAVEAAVIGVKAEVVGLSVRNIDNNDMRDTVFFLDDLKLTVNAIRNLTGAPIILGGAALGVMPEEILRLVNVSYGVTGDGETVFPLLLERIAQQEPFDDLSGIAYVENGAFRKNPYPLSDISCGEIAPDYRRWVNVPAYQSQLATAPVQTKIGCQFQCVYCTYRKIEGGAYRLSDPEEVAHAVQQLSASGLRDIELVDSVFNAPYDHSLIVCEALARTRHNARLQSLELNPRYFDDRLVSAMERAGFSAMGLTVESASDRVLQGLGKAFTSQHVRQAAEVVRRHKLICVWIFLLGGPGETEETVKETIRFAETSIRPSDAVFFNIGIRIYPGTELEAIARKQWILSLPAREMLKPVFYVSPEVSAGWIEQEVKKAMAGHMNFINTDSIGHSFLPTIHRIGYRLGIRPPLWRYTRFIRRGLRMMGMDV